LVVISDETRTRVTLEGTAASAPTCASANSCVSAAFDSESQNCVQTPVPEGTPCQSACLSGAECRDGRCVGTAPWCDDDNPCTIDACSPDRGCIHLAPEEPCADPAELCLVGVCEPKLGSTMVPVADGTSCGAFDCVAAHICVAGICETRAPRRRHPLSGAIDRGV
jgi:hypothetical protein